MHFKEYKNILSSTNGMNIYRGCDHGCIYCDSRSKCYGMSHEFEDIEVKLNAFEILDNELALKRKRVMVGTGSMSDPYNHVEESLMYTRKCLEVIYKHHCGVTIITKSDLILRDMDLLDKINKDSKVVVQVTLTTADDNLCKIIEPNVCVTSKRVEILKKCKKLGIPTIVWLCPFLPYINDTKENIEKLLDYCKEAGVYGVLFFGIGLTLREGNREYFYKKLEENFKGLRERYIRQYGFSYEVPSNDSWALSNFVIEYCKKNNIKTGNNELFKYMQEYPPEYEQLSLF